MILPQLRGNAEQDLKLNAEVPPGVVTRAQFLRAVKRLELPLNLPESDVLAGEFQLVADTPPTPQYPIASPPQSPQRPNAPTPQRPNASPPPLPSLQHGSVSATCVSRACRAAPR